MHQTCKNMYHEKVHQPCTKPIQIMYHEQVHQPCTKPVQITCHKNLSEQPITRTCLINLINQIRSTHQDQSASNNIAIEGYIIHKPCFNNTNNKYLQPCTKYVPIMYQLLINYDSSICTNIINYTPHVCVNSSTTCLSHVPNMYLKRKPSSISPSKYDL
jgi:hypothetical protein